MRLLILVWAFLVVVIFLPLAIAFAGLMEKIANVL